MMFSVKSQHPDKEEDEYIDVLKGDPPLNDRPRDDGKLRRVSKTVTSKFSLMNLKITKNDITQSFFESLYVAVLVF